MTPIYPTMWQWYPASIRDLMDYLDSLVLTPEERLVGIAYLDGPDDVCVVDGCDQPSRSRDMCQRHYDSWRYRNMGLVVTQHRNSATCTVEGCSKPSRAKNMCRPHYDKAKRRDYLHR